MCDSIIAWTEFSWEAFATLTGGILAVVAALAVGIRQTQISRDQTTILARQVHLAELEQKIALYDKRMEIFHSANDFLVEVLHHTGSPPPETRNDYLKCLNLSRFLFSPALFNKLNEIWHIVGELVVLKAEMQMSWNAHGHYGDGNPAKELALLTKIDELRRNLPDDFEEMRPIGG